LNTIRPQHPQPTPAPQPQAQRLSGQSALFALARGRVAEAVTTPTTAEPAPLDRTAQAEANPPQKILRPGSLLDIRI